MSTISEAIIKDHRELEQYYNEVVNNTNDSDHQERFGNQFIWELARHSVGEELVVYPAFEKHLDAQGKAMAESDRKAHHEGSSCPKARVQSLLTYLQIKEMLKVFQGMNVLDPKYVAKLKELWGLLSEHIKEEEDHDLPALEAKLRSVEDESESMAKTFNRTKAFVPTRSHPSAGEHPPFETVMGLLTAPIDHVADIFRKFPDKTISPNPSTK